MSPLAPSLLALLERYGFVADATGTRWSFRGHPTQACDIQLRVDDAPEGRVYILKIEAFPGGSGYEDELRYTASQRPELEQAIVGHCEEALEPYIKTRLQRLFEPFLGHDLAWVLFHRRPRS